MWPCMANSADACIMHDAHQFHNGLPCGLTSSLAYRLEPSYLLMFSSSNILGGHANILGLVATEQDVLSAVPACMDKLK